MSEYLASDQYNLQADFHESDKFIIACSRLSMVVTTNYLIYSMLLLPIKLPKGILKITRS